MKIKFTLHDADIVRLVSHSCEVKPSAVRAKLKTKAFRKQITQFVKEIFIAKVTDDFSIVGDEFHECFTKEDELPES